MEQKFYDMMEANPVIAAVKDTDGLEKCCRMEEIKVIFILYGDICSIDGIVRRVRECGKLAFVHVDLITGLGAKEIAVDFIRQQTGADGIISTKPAMIRLCVFLSWIPWLLKISKNSLQWYARILSKSCQG